MKCRPTPCLVTHVRVCFCVEKKFDYLFLLSKRRTHQRRQSPLPCDVGVRGVVEQHLDNLRVAPLSCVVERVASLFVSRIDVELPYRVPPEKFAASSGPARMMQGPEVLGFGG
jgi:hypothetical protein